jgi:hypothetical protein
MYSTSDGYVRKISGRLQPKFQDVTVSNRKLFHAAERKMKIGKYIIEQRKPNKNVEYTLKRNRRKYA